MTTEEFWAKYIHGDIFKIYDIVCDFFSRELPKEFLEGYDAGEVILETRGHHETAKEFDKVLKFTELIQDKQPQLYREYFQYFDDFLIDYYCFLDESEKAESAFSNFLESPVPNFDSYLICFKKFLFYQYTDLLSQAITANYDEVDHSDELIGGAAHDLALSKFYITLEHIYLKYEKNNVFDKDALKEVLDQYGFNFDDKAFADIERGICEPVLQQESLINDFTGDRKQFELTLQGYFLKYMYQRNLTFMLSGRLWDKLLVFWEESNSTKRLKPDTYFSVNLKKYERYLSVLSGDMFLSNRSEMIAVLWGSVYIYDFLKSIELISQETYDRFIKVSRILKGKVIGLWTKDLWNSDFVHRWQKPDGISSTEFEEEAKIFQKSISFKNLEFTRLRKEIAEELEHIGELSRYIIEGGKSGDDRVDSSLSEELFDPEQEVEVNENSDPEEHGDRIIPVRTEKKIGRNDPCPCGSGKKYKKCCGQS